MVIVSKATATTQKGEIKKGYRCVKAKNGRDMYMTELKAKDSKAPKKKVETKKKKADPVYEDHAEMPKKKAPKKKKKSSSSEKE